jgi:glycosyltransferase involved in cell wall biosynthesis
MIFGEIASDLVHESDHYDRPKMVVSVIVPTLNSGRVIEHCLRSITDQTYKQIEILVIDGGSTDATVAIAHRFADRVIESDVRSGAYQMNLGALNAKGDLLLYVDSDEVLHPNLIEECVQKTVIGKFDGLFVFTIDTGTTYLGRSRCLGDIISLGAGRDLRMSNATIRFCTKSVFKAAGKYDEDLVMGEDVIFALNCISRGFRIGRCKNPILHFGTEGLGHIFAKKYQYGKTMKIYIKKAKSLGFSVRHKYLLTGLFYLRHLFKFKIYCARYLFGFIIVKIVENIGLSLGYFSARLNF